MILALLIATVSFRQEEAAMTKNQQIWQLSATTLLKQQKLLT